MYIGSHTGTDKYYKAGGVAIRRAFRKHGIENFHREFLYVGPDYRAVEEKFLVAVDAMRNVDYYNLINASVGVGVGKDNHQHGKLGELAPNYGRVWSQDERNAVSVRHKGKIMSAESRSKIRESMSGDKNHNFGKQMPKNQRDKISRTRITRGSSKGANNPMYGKPRTDEVKAKLREANLGKKYSQETKDKQSKAKLGVKHEILKCPHCPKSGGKSAMKRWHFDNCKDKED